MQEFERTFENAALIYDSIRPDYPDELFNDIFSLCSLSEKSKVLEIGMGSGKATKPFLDTKCELIGIEPGADLANIAVERFKRYSNFSSQLKTLQEYECDSDTFDLIFSATAFHWIPEEYGYIRVHKLLKCGGVFARFAYHAGRDTVHPGLADEIHKQYAKYLGRSGTKTEFSTIDAAKTANIALKYGFTDASHKIYYNPKNFTADEYMLLLKTYPDHMKLDAKLRAQLFDGIYSAINNHGGVITINYVVDLELAIKHK